MSSPQTAIKVHTDKLISDMSDVEYKDLLHNVKAQVKAKLLEQACEKAVVYIEQHGEHKNLRSIYACRYDAINKKIYFFHAKGDA